MKQRREAFSHAASLSQKLSDPPVPVSAIAGSFDCDAVRSADGIFAQDDSL